MGRHLRLSIHHSSFRIQRFFFLTFPRPFVFNQYVSVRGAASVRPPDISSADPAPRADPLPPQPALTVQSQDMSAPSQVSGATATILVVEDDERARRGLVRAFESEGHRVVACGDAAEALGELHRESCDFVVKSETARELLTRVGAHLEAAERERALQGSNRELAFIADLGRGLLHALSLAEVVRRVAGATYEGADAALCAAALIEGGREKVKDEAGRA